MLKKINFKALLDTIKENIVEMSIFTALYIWIAFISSDDIDNIYFVAISAIAFAVAQCLNSIFNEGKGRYIYFLSWIPFLGLAFLNLGSEWVNSSQGLITCSILTPLLLVLGRRAYSNDRFVEELLNVISALGYGAFFTSILSLLYFAIEQSIMAIFFSGFNGSTDVSSYFYTLFYSIVPPLSFLHFSSKRYDLTALSDSSGFKILINYILSPAIILYAVILYMYIVKAVFTWQLPDGYIAYLVFFFTLITITVKAVSEKMKERLFSLFFKYFSFIAIPILVIFWIGVARRISEYGFTDWRVYLVVCGAIMTICVGMFTVKKIANYYAVASIAFLLYFTMAYIPYYSASQIAMRSQYDRVIENLEFLSLLDSNGKITSERKTSANDEEIKAYKKLYSSALYLYREYPEVVTELGINSKADILQAFPIFVENELKGSPYTDRLIIYDYDIRHKKPVDVSKYQYSVGLFAIDNEKETKEHIGCYDYSNDTLKIYLEGKLIRSDSKDELILDRLNSMIKEDGIKEINSTTIDKYKNEFRLFETKINRFDSNFRTSEYDPIMIMVDNIKLSIDENGVIDLDLINLSQLYF